MQFTAKFMILRWEIKPPVNGIFVQKYLYLRTLRSTGIGHLQLLNYCWWLGETQWCRIVVMKCDCRLRLLCRILDAVVLGLAAVPACGPAVAVPCDRAKSTGLVVVPAVRVRRRRAAQRGRLDVGGVHRYRLDDQSTSSV